MLVLGFDLYLIVLGKAVHKGKYLASHTFIQNLINKWRGGVIFRTIPIQFSKINTYLDGPLLHL